MRNFLNLLLRLIVICLISCETGNGKEIPNRENRYMKEEIDYSLLELKVQCSACELTVEELFSFYRMRDRKIYWQSNSMKMSQEAMRKDTNDILQRYKTQRGLSESQFFKPWLKLPSFLKGSGREGYFSSNKTSGYRGWWYSPSNTSGYRPTAPIHVKPAHQF